MKMKKCTAAILLVLSLEALVAGRLSAAVADDGADSILLPSQGLADELAAVAMENGGEVKRPWKCCDHTFCNRKMPPGCRCMDTVERCDKACSRCEKSPSDPSKHICMDRYTGDPGPSCTKHGNDLAYYVLNGLGVASHEATAAATEAVSEKSVVDGEEDASPWKCCDLPRCTRSFPTVCQCLDKVKKCAKTCKNCEKAVGSNGASSRFVCRDTYGKLAPPCTKSVASGPGVPGREATAAVAVAATEASSEKSVGNGEEQARPWTCCDDTLCTRSAPPTCQCLDKVKKCAKTCKSCEKADGLNGASSRFVCHDRYFGWPGPKCGKSGAADVILGN